MANLGYHVKSLASLTAFTVAISFCFLLVVVYYVCSSGDTYKRSLYRHENQLSNHVPRIFKRTADPHNRFHYYKNCIPASPSPEDIHKLCSNQECDTVHCIRSCRCGDSSCNVSLRMTCFTRACMQFRVKIGQAENEVSLERFSDVLNDYLSRLQDIKDIEVSCSDNSSHLLDRKLDLEITRNDLDFCTLEGVGQSKHIKPTGEIHQPNRSKPDVYLIYFRLMSKWESLIKLPRLNSLIEHTRKDMSWNLYSFDNIQSDSFVLDNNLRSVLGVSGVSSSTSKTVSLEEDDLIELAMKDGKCVFFHTLTCHKSGIYRKIQDTLQANNDNKCLRHETQHHHTISDVDYHNHTFCEDSNKDTDMEDILHIHHRIGQIYPTTKANSFSVFVVNIPDLKSIETFDTTISGMVTQVLSQASNILILMSDVGDPKYSRFDESVFLRTKVFNPLLHVFISARTALEDPTMSLLISELSIKSPKAVLGISFVHTMLYTIIKEGNTTIIKEGNKSTKNLEKFLTSNDSSGNLGKDGTVNMMCPLREVSGPVECVCEGRHVQFPNDSTQVAFANFIVGSVNNKLLGLSSLNKLRMDLGYFEGKNPKMRQLQRNRYTCDRLHGVCATNVNHLLWERSTFIILTLYLRPASRLYSPTIRMKAEVEYSTDDTYNTNFTVNILHPTKIALDDLTNSSNKNLRALLHLLCREPSDITRENPTDGQFLHAISTEVSFGVKAKTKPLHYPCLYLLTRSHGDSAGLEVANVCTNRIYNVTVSIDYVNILSLVAVPKEIVVGSREVKFITTLVKNGYWVSVSGYKVHASYVVSMM